MRFITEYDLRALYKTDPFTSYKIEEGTRLTPGARQFLADKGIRQAEDSSKKAKEAAVKEGTAAEHKKLKAEINVLESLFLLTATELLPTDAWLARDIMDLGKRFETPKQGLECKACHGITKTNFSQELGDCFNIWTLDIKHEKAREVLLLHKLRCSLRRFAIDVENTELEIISNQIVNTISQIICAMLGGGECLRKN